MAVAEGVDVARMSLKQQPLQRAVTMDMVRLSLRRLFRRAAAVAVDMDVGRLSLRRQLLRRAVAADVVRLSLRRLLLRRAVAVAVAVAQLSLQPVLVAKVRRVAAVGVGVGWLPQTSGYMIVSSAVPNADMQSAVAQFVATPTRFREGNTEQEPTRTD